MYINDYKYCFSGMKSAYIDVYCLDFIGEARSLVVCIQCWHICNGMWVTSRICSSCDVTSALPSSKWDLYYKIWILYLKNVTILNCGDSFWCYRWHQKEFWKTDTWTLQDLYRFCSEFNFSRWNFLCLWEENFLMIELCCINYFCFYSSYLSKLWWHWNCSSLTVKLALLWQEDQAF